MRGEWRADDAVGDRRGRRDSARRLLSLSRRAPLLACLFFLTLPPHHTHSQEFKPSDFGWHKTKIAQLLTVKRERTLAAGVNKRESRRAEKAEKVAAGFGQF